MGTARTPETFITQKHTKENGSKLINCNEFKRENPKKRKNKNAKQVMGESGQTSSHQAYPEQLLAVNTTLMYCPFFLSDL